VSQPGAMAAVTACRELGTIDLLTAGVPPAAIL
jgi:hypothetical protein